MFNAITVPYDAVMMFNEITLKPEKTIEDVELALGEMCNVVKETYGNDGFIAGQVFRRTGDVSEEGSIIKKQEDPSDKICIVTYWKSFEQHERSHADSIFKQKFSELMKECEDSYEVAYQLLWQGEYEG